MSHPGDAKQLRVITIALTFLRRVFRRIGWDRRGMMIELSVLKPETSLTTSARTGRFRRPRTAFGASRGKAGPTYWNGTRSTTHPINHFTSHRLSPPSPYSSTVASVVAGFVARRIAGTVQKKKKRKNNENNAT